MKKQNVAATAAFQQKVDALVEFVQCGIGSGGH